MSARFLKVIACEIAFREICHLAAQSPNLFDLEFLSQGLHDHPRAGCKEIQQRIDAVPAGRYEAILLGYGLCGNIITGLEARHTQLVIPRAHDCITFFLGSRKRYQQMNEECLGTYYFTSGWLECLRRRGQESTEANASFLPMRADVQGTINTTYQNWVTKYGEERARYLMETISQWTQHYSQGALIDFEFTKPLGLGEKVKQICTHRGWQFQELPGDLTLLKRWLDGDWDEKDFLVVPPAQSVTPTYDEAIMGVETDLSKTEIAPAEADHPPLGREP